MRIAIFHFRFSICHLSFAIAGARVNRQREQCQMTNGKSKMENRSVFTHQQQENSQWT